MPEANAIPTAERRPVLAGHRFANTHVSLSPAAPATRWSVRGDAKAAGKALGVKLPEQPNGSHAKGTRTALALGPDEWLVIDESVSQRPDTPEGDDFVSVDVSHRNTAVLVSGDGAEATLNAGCPRDLGQRAFPVGACARTVLGKSEIVLLRTGDSEFRVECWRSFAPYVWAFLEDAAGDAGL